MLHWILRHLKDAGRSTVALLGAVWDAFRAVWTTLESLGLNQIRQWVRIAQLAIRSVGSVITLLVSLYQTLRWAFLYLIPHWAIAESRKVLNWAVRELKALGHEVIVLLGDLRNFLLRELKALGHAVDVLFAAAYRRIVAAEATLVRMGRLVFDLLVHPEHLALFVFGALWRLFWRTAERLAEPIARWLFRKLLPVVIHELPLVERILSDLF